MSIYLKPMLSAAVIATAISINAGEPAGEKLTGTIIGTELSVDFTNGQATTSVNTKEEAFDGDLETCFASYDRSFTWVGLDLGQRYVITGVGYSPRNDNLGPERMVLGIFQGANTEDFSDAIPFYLIKERGTIGVMSYADVECSRGFRYVRYVGPHDARCNIAEIEFYGTPGAGDDTHLYSPTNLPLVVVNTPNMEWFHERDKSYEMNGSLISIIKDGQIDVSASGQIRGRGNASWDFPKKPFRIKFDKKQSVLGSDYKAKKWTMINNYGDKTLMRNKLAFDISERLGMPFTPSCNFVDLIFNGEYEGTYQLCDQVEVNKGRVDITEMEPEDIEGEALTGGYLIEIDAYASNEPADEWFYSTGGHQIPVTIKSPDAGVQQQYNYIRNRFSDLERALFASNFADPDNGYRSRMDLDSFLKHFIVGELSGNTDTYWSTYMSLERGEDRFNVGPVWDFDLAFDNDVRIYPVNNHSDFICLSGGSLANGMYDFVKRIIREDTQAKERLKVLWSMAREYQGLDYDTFKGLVDQYAEDLEQSQQLNFKRWPILGQIVHQNHHAYGNYASEVKVVRNYLSKRFAKLDQLIGRVEVSGVEAPTASAAKVKTGRGFVTIECGGEYAIYNMQGIMVACGMGNGTCSLPTGCYILRTATTATKVLIP